MTTIDESEVEKFSKIADEWWDENGKFKPLHKFNPIRLSFFKQEICKFFSRDEKLL
jgi:2-polyprenyl-6-hydroxyphenyl methylase/3-demethylubiquinone-9 3-methyltransferase